MSFCFPNVVLSTFRNAELANFYMKGFTLTHWGVNQE